MFAHFLCRCRINSISRTIPFLQNPSSFVVTRFINSDNFTLDYLTNSCGLSPQSALKASKLIQLRSTTGPDSVLSLFNSYGFTKPQISKLIASLPRLLLARTDKTLKPKLEYFSNIGIAGPDLAKIISSNPFVLTLSLRNTIIPSVHYLRSLVGTDQGLIVILKRSWWVLSYAEHLMKPNIAMLRDLGVPQSNITKSLMFFPQTFYRTPHSCTQKVSQLVSMGFSPSSMTFMCGLYILTAVSKPKWDEKLAICKTFGWSEDEVLSVFTKYPFFMSASVKKISLVFDFLMNSLKWTKEDIARNPSVVTYSLDKRIIPRCRVLQILLTENLISKASMGKALRVSDNVFLERYVIKFQTEISDLLKVYQSMMAAHSLLVGAKGGRDKDKI